MSSEPIPKHPVAPRMRPKKPHIGPDFSAYKAMYDRSVGPNSDEWWANVSTTAIPIVCAHHILSDRLLVKPCIGIVRSPRSRRVVSRLVTSPSSPKAVSMPPTTASIGGPSSTQTRYVPRRYLSSYPHLRPRSPSSTRPTNRASTATSPSLNSSARSAASPMSSKISASRRVTPSPCTCP